MKLSEMKASKRPRAEIESPVVLLIDVKALREKYGVTLRDCVKPSGISLATLQRIESGKPPDIVSALRFSDFLGLSIPSIWKLKK